MPGRMSLEMRAIDLKYGMNYDSSAVVYTYINWVNGCLHVRAANVRCSHQLQSNVYCEHHVALPFERNVRWGKGVVQCAQIASIQYYYPETVQFAQRGTLREDR